MIIAIDFDGTIVESAFPEIGAEIDGAIDTIKYIISLGHKVILHTCRTNHEIAGRRPLDEAAEWLRSRGLELYAVNDNPEARMTYGEQTKVSADLYIDDRAFGVPTVDGHVDWETVRAHFWLKSVREQADNFFRARS